MQQCRGARRVRKDLERQRVAARVRAGERRDDIDVAAVAVAFDAEVTQRDPAGGVPRILRIIHSPNDTLAEVRPEQMARAIVLVEQLIRTIDRAG